MKKSRVLAVILCAALVFALAACNSGGGSGGSGGSSGTGGAVPNRDHILVGYAAPMTGPMSIFMMPTPWVAKMMEDHINNTLGGIDIGGKKLPIKVVYADNESDPNTAMDAATKLVTQDQVDILIGGWTPVGTNTASAVGERHGVPTLVFGAPEESWLDGGPYQRSYGFTFNYDHMVADMINMWDKIDTNKKIGYLFDTTVDGTVGRDVHNRLLEGKGYTIVDPGPFNVGTNDYTAIVSKFKDENVEIVSADMITPDFALFWRQCQQYDFKPKVVTINKGMHYANDAAKMEPIGIGLSFAALWDKNYPFSSSLLGMSASEIADKYEAEHNEFYPYSIGHDVAMYDVLYDVFNRAASLSREDVRTALAATNINTVFGNFKFAENRNMKVPAIATQWIEGDKFLLDKIIVASDYFPSVPTNGTPIVIPYK
jgi:branched-chain amino acid transport system substrate-binding protein